MRHIRGAVLTLSLAAASALHAQEPVVSMGQPSRWQPYAGAALTLTGLSGTTATGGAAFLGVQRPLINPLIGGPTLAAEGYVGAAGAPVDGMDGGVRGAVALPIFFTQLGVDWNFRLDRAQFFMSAIFPPVRGGLFGRGGQLRVDWIPARDQTLQFAVTMPIGQRWAGRTRPRHLETPLPKPPKRAAAAPLAPEGEAILAGVRDYALRTGRWGFPISWSEGKSYEDALALADSFYTGFAASLAQGDALSPSGHSAAGDRAVYLRETDRLFAWAAGAEALGPVLGDSARAAVLDEVWLPYDRAMGQYKSPDGLAGLAAAARTRFERALGAVPDDRRDEVLAAFDGWVGALDDVRAWILKRGRDDSRGTWLPMQLVLRPEQHDTQHEIDALVQRALGATFSGGNSAIYLAGQQFQPELRQQIAETRRYHVLWIHDYRGLTPAGFPDIIGYYQTESYLRALTARVREYDRTGVLPTYLIFLDQNYYEANTGHLWLTLLEDPLGATLKLPKPPKTPHVVPDVAEQLMGRGDSLAARVRAWQDSLRQAVAGSSRLQELARANGGEGWLRRTVKVHVSITQPSDLTFRTSRLLGLPFASDNLVRDHRKIAFYDVTESDPGAGSAIYAGVGVGESYSSATWEDRALLVQGPALVALKTSARELLLANGFREQEIPAPLRAEPFPADYAARVAELERSGAGARVLQVHNRVGFGQKDATVMQMMLYDLMPAGSVIYVPDSIWTSFLWTGQLVAAALRGCHVYIVAPAAANAPSAGSPTLSRTQELYAQTVVLQRVLRDAITQAGGRFRVGLYTRQAHVGQRVQSLREIAATLRAHPDVAADFPLGDEFFAEFTRLADSLEAAGYQPPTFVDDEVPRAPKMHRKTQFLASRAMLEALARDERVRQRFRDDMRSAVRSALQPPAPARVLDDPRVAAERPLLEAHEALPAAVRDDAPAYLTVGSLNKDWRGAALDGESLAVVAGPWALIGWIDFLYLAGHTTWIEDIDQLEKLLPPFTEKQRAMGRKMRNII